MKTLKRPGQAAGQRRAVELGHLKFGHGVREEVYAGDELLHVMRQVRKLEESLAERVRQGSSRLRRIHLALMFPGDGDVDEAHQADGVDPLVRAVVDVLDAVADELREHLLEPLGFHGGGQRGQRHQVAATAADLAEIGRDEQGGFLHDAFADKRRGAVPGQDAIERADVLALAKLVGETGRDRTEKAFVRGALLFGWSHGHVVVAVVGHEALLPRDADDLLEGLVHFAGDLGIDAVALAGADVEPLVARELPGAHQRVEVRLLASLEDFTCFGNVLLVA